MCRQRDWRERGQPSTHRQQFRASHDQGRVPEGVPGQGSEIGVQGNQHPGIFEHPTVAGFQVALAGQPFGEHHAVVVQFDMKISESGGRRHLSNACAVDEIFHRDQHIIGKDSVIGGQKQVAPWHAVAERTAAHAHGQHIARPGVACWVDLPTANPAHGLWPKLVTG